MVNELEISVMPELRHQLRQIVEGFRAYHGKHDRLYQDNHDLVLREGREYKPSVTRYRTIPKACFQQAYRMALARQRKWIYVEGYGLRGDFPIIAAHHAWIVDPERPDEAVDLAWPYHPATAYLGIAFKHCYVRECHVASKRMWYSVLDNWWQEFPLLHGAHKLEEVRHVG